MEDKRYLKEGKSDNYMRYSLIFLLFLMMFSFTSALKVNENYQLVISSNNATTCTAPYIEYPDGTKAIYNLPLTKDGTSFYTTINGSNFTKIGNTCIGVSCYNGVTYTTGDKCIDVSPSGFLDNAMFYVLILVLSLGVIVMGFWMKDATITILGSLGLYFIALYVLFFGINGMKDPVYTWAFGLITLGIAMYISIRSTYELIVDGVDGYFG